MAGVLNIQIRHIINLNYILNRISNQGDRIFMVWISDIE